MRHQHDITSIVAVSVLVQTMAALQLAWLSPPLLLLLASVSQAGARKHVSFQEFKAIRHSTRPRFARTWEDACAIHRLELAPTGAVLELPTGRSCLWYWEEENNRTEEERVLQRRQESTELWIDKEETDRAGELSGHTSSNFDGLHTSYSL